MRPHSGMLTQMCFVFCFFFSLGFMEDIAMVNGFIMVYTPTNWRIYKWSMSS